MLLAGSACGGASASKRLATSDAGPHTSERTVSIEVLRVGERSLETDEGAGIYYPKVTPLGGVEICVVKQRAAFASFQSFEALRPKICRTNVANETVRLSGVPANSDLLMTYTKQGFRPVMTTFRTDEFDVAVPTWADNSTYFIPLVREDAALPVESTPTAQTAQGLVAIWVTATGEYGTGDGTAVFNADEDPGAAQADGVEVQVDDAAGHSITTLRTLRDRPLFISLPQSSYALRFTHPVMELVPTGVQEQYMIGGLPTDVENTIEVPIEPPFLSLATVDGFCPLPPDDSQPFRDLATCTLSDIRDAGMP